jgi:hypothetical protein
LLAVPQGLHDAWNPADVASSVADLVVSRKQENLDEKQMGLLASVATQAAALGKLAGPGMVERWSQVRACVSV